MHHSKYLTIKMKMPNFDFTPWKEHNHENLFAINKLSNFYIIQLAS